MPERLTKPKGAMPLRWVTTLAITGMSVLGILAMLAAVDHVVKREIYAETLSSLRQASIDARDRMDAELYKRYRDLAILVTPLNDLHNDADSVRKVIIGTQKAFPDYSWLAYVLPDGTVQVANDGILEGRSVAQRPWFAPSLKAPFLGDVHEAILLADILGPDGQGQAPRFIDFGFPVKDSTGTTVGVLAAHLNWDWAARVLEPMRGKTDRRDGYEMLILDKDGLVLHGPVELRGKPLPGAGSLDDGAVWDNGEGTLSVVAAGPSKLNFNTLGWKIVLRAQDTDTFSLINVLRSTIAGTAIPIILLFAVFGALLARMISRPIEALQRAALEGTAIPTCRRFTETALLAQSFDLVLKSLNTEKAEIENRVLQRTKELQDLFRVVDAHSIVSIADKAGNIIDCNERFCEVSGYSKEELIGQNHRLVKSDQHGPEFYANLWKTISSGNIWRGVVCNKAKDGSYYWVQSTIAPVQSGSDSEIRYISIRTDITDVTLDQMRLDDLANQMMIFRQIIDTTEEAISILDANNTYIYGNKARERLTGVPLDALRGQRIIDMLPQAAEAQINALQQATKAGHSWRGLLPMQRADGSTFISASNVGAVVNDDGETQFSFNIFRDHTPELQRTQELEDARNRAIEANRAKSEFLSNMSHELRTPLNAILGFAQLMLTSRKQPLSDSQKEQIGYILKGGEHLLSLINEVLDLAKIEAGKMSISVEPIALDAVLQECLLMAETTFKAHNVTVFQHHLGAAPTLFADRVRTKQVILNLLSNAAKYNRPGGTISLTGEILDDGLYRFVVADTGRGIPKDRIPELFQPFSRLGAETSDIEGTGVGLALTRTLMETMNGRVGMDSVEGQGSRFWLDFPIARDDENSAAETPILPPSNDFHRNEQGLVLYVEDNPANIRLMEQLFSEMPNLQLLIATSAEDALPLAREFRPALIILDINLPGMSGIEAAKILRANPSTTTTPILALSADATELTQRKAIAAGFSQYLSKPVNIYDLTLAISTLIGQEAVYDAAES